MARDTSTDQWESNGGAVYEAVIPEHSSAKSATVRVVLLSPLPGHKFVAHGYTITAEGADVDRDDIERVYEAAAHSGVTVKVDA